MRIVAGAHRGRTLVAPKGHSTRPTADRARQALFNVLEHAPWSGGLAGLRVVDLFAGSGALGLEALSRGAAFCLFVESDPSAAAAIETNIAALRVRDRSDVRRWNAIRLAPLLSSPSGGGGRIRPTGPRRGGGGDAADASPSRPPSPASPVLPPGGEERGRSGASPPPMGEGDPEGVEGAFDLAFLDPPYGKGFIEPALAALVAAGWLAPDAIVVVEQAAGEPSPAAPGYAILDSRTWGAARVWFLRLGEA